MKGLSLKAIAQVLNGTLYLGGEDVEIQGAVTDNRDIQEGYLFIPLKGARVDGHSFIEDAFDRGAVCVLTEYAPKELVRKGFIKAALDNTESKGSYIEVKSTSYALKRLAAFYRTCLSIPIIGVVGSVGKTGTKEMIASVLGSRFNVLYTKGNYNNEIGLPLTLLRIREEHDVAVVEMGINHFGEMDRLGAIAQPDMVVFTNVKECHLESLGDRSGVLKAKSEVFAHILSGGAVFLNTDDDMLRQVDYLEDKRIICFGTDNQPFHASDIEPLGINGVKAVLHTPLFDAPVHIHLPGAHNIYHALAAAAVGEYIGLSREEIINAIEGVGAIDGRSHVIHPAENVTVIDDCYNASPASMTAALELLSSLEGTKIAVLGDMGELGDEEGALHYQLGLLKAFNSIDMLFCVGERSKEIIKALLDSDSSCNAKGFDTKEKMEEALLTAIRNATKEKEQVSVLVKASHFMGYSKVVDAIVASYQ